MVRVSTTPVIATETYNGKWLCSYCKPHPVSLFLYIIFLSVLRSSTYQAISHVLFGGCFPKALPSWPCFSLSFSFKILTFSKSTSHFFHILSLQVFLIVSPDLNEVAFLSRNERNHAISSTLIMLRVGDIPVFSLLVGKVVTAAFYPQSCCRSLAVY